MRWKMIRHKMLHGKDSVPMKCHIPKTFKTKVIATKSAVCAIEVYNPSGQVTSE